MWSREHSHPVPRLSSPTRRASDLLDFSAQQFLATVAEEFLSLGVDQDDPAGRVDDHDGVGGRLQECPGPRLRPPALGYGADGAADQNSLLSLQRAEADLKGELAAV